MSRCIFERSSPKNSQESSFIKQSYDFEDIRVPTYNRLKSMATLVLAGSYFAAVTPLVKIWGNSLLIPS